MPSVTALFKESWDTFKKSIFNVLILQALGFAIFFVIAFVAIIVFAGLGFGAAVALKGNMQTLTHMSPFLLIAVGVAVLALIVFMTYVGIAMQAATYIVVAEADSKTGATDALKRGFGLVGGIFTTSLLVWFIAMGGTFLFLIPGIVFSLLFGFVQYEVVLDNKRGTAALKSSIHLIKTHFFDIVVRWGVFIGMVMIVQFVLNMFSLAGSFAGAMNKSYSPFSPLNGSIFLVRFIFGIFVGWYGLSYGYNLYKQVKAATQPSEKPQSLAVFWVLSILGWVLGILLVVGLVSAIVTNKETILKAMNESKSNSKTLETNTSTNEKITLDQDQADELASESTDEVNTYRENHNLTAYTEDSHLCAYAQRRLEQLDLLGKYDDSKGFYEDIANTQMSAAYFKGFSYIGEQVYGPYQGKLLSASDLVNLWGNPKTPSTNNIITSKTYNNFCVRANTHFLMVVAGEK